MSRLILTLLKSVWRKASCIDHLNVIVGRRDVERPHLSGGFSLVASSQFLNPLRANSLSAAGAVAEPAHAIEALLTE